MYKYLRPICKAWRGAVMAALGPRNHVSTKLTFYTRKLSWILGLRERFETPVGTLSIPRASVSPTIFWHLTTGDYETPERTLLDQHLDATDRIIELGAGIGFLANLYGRRCPEARHLAIEASPVMCDLIRVNTQALGNVDVLNALAGRDAHHDTRDFYVYRDFWASSTQPIHETDPTRQLVRTVQVPMVDLDALIAERRCTFLVCDIEGGEDALVRTFDLKVPKILMELHWRELGMARALRILRLFEDRGYTLSGSPDVFFAVKTSL